MRYIQGGQEDDDAVDDTARAFDLGRGGVSNARTRRTCYAVQIIFLFSLRDLFSFILRAKCKRTGAKIEYICEIYRSLLPCAFEL